MNKVIVELTLDRIKENPFDARKVMTGVDELAASFLSVGQIVPIVVRPFKTKGDGDEGWLLIAGHRRVAAAKSLGWDSIAALVFNEATEAHEAILGLTENTSRVDLNQTDLANAIGRLVGMDVTDDEIALALSIKPDVAAAARTLTATPKAARTKTAKLAEAYPITIIQQAKIAAYAEDGKDLDKIKGTLKYSPEQLDHTIARIEHDRKRKATLAELRATVGKTPIVKKFNSWSGPPLTTEPLANLVSDKLKKLTLANHHECPGHAAMIEDGEYSNTAPKITYWCTQWKEQGHKLSDTQRIVWSQRGEGRVAPKTQTPAEKAKVAEENKLHEERIAAWDAASTVRHAYLADRIKHKLSADMKLWTLRYIATTGLDSYYTEAVGINATLEQVVCRLFGFVAAQIEETEFSVTPWKGGTDDGHAYLAMLAEDGYVLSDVEQLVKPEIIVHKSI